MAKSPKNTAPPPNIDAAKAQIDEAMVIALELTELRAAAITEHVKPIDDKLTKLFRGVKKDTNVAIADLKAMFALLKRQNEAKMMDDADEGDRVLMNMRLIFEALTEGDNPTLDFTNPFEDGDDEDEGDEGEDGDDEGEDDEDPSA